MFSPNTYIEQRFREEARLLSQLHHGGLPKVFDFFKDTLIPDTCVVIRGKFSKRNGEASVLADSVKKL